jgi:hypothetical protein
MQEMNLRTLIDDIEEWREAYEEVSYENKIFYDALRRLTTGEFGFKARDVAREAIERVRRLKGEKE